jgi:hypothetical protein
MLPHLRQQVDLVAGDELQPLQVVAELVELTQRSAEGVRRRRTKPRDMVELACGIELDLPVGGDLRSA